MVEDGREKVSSTLKALEKHGYLRRVQQYDENGGFTDLLYTFSDEPVFHEGTHKLGEENFCAHIDDALSRAQKVTEAVQK
jgi:hypothetical protein